MTESRYRRWLQGRAAQLLRLDYGSVNKQGMVYEKSHVRLVKWV